MSIKVVSEHTEESSIRRELYGKRFEKPSLTVQADKDKCCINNIMARWRKTGLVDHITAHRGQYGDFASGADFTAAMNVVAAATQSFGQLPAELRKRFSNDPAEFLNFVSDESNFDEMVKMGLANARPVPAPSAPQNADAGAGTSPDGGN